MQRILLVDDDESFRKMLRKTLIRMGYDVLEARNGDEALKAYELELVDLMLTDLVMPESEGLETISAFKRKHSGAKIIAMSGGGRVSAKDYLNVAKMLGANRVLSKPFSNEEMEAAIKDVLGKADSV
jgi:DNA-binding response OmpR family regulator